MVRTKWYTDKMVWDKMVRTICSGIDYKSSEFNSYLVTKSHNLMINTHRKPKRLKVETGLANKIILSMGVELMYCLMILLLKSYPYHFVRTILSIPFCPIPFCPYTILSIPFCPYHFVRYHFVLEPKLAVRAASK